MLTTFESSVKGYRTFVDLPNGERIPVRFEIVQYQTTEGPSLFHTGDKRVVEALKKHPRFNDVFFLKFEPREEEVEVKPIVPLTKPEEVKFEDMVNPDKEVVHDSSVTTAALARAYIQQHYGQPVPTDCKTNAQIKEFAARTYNLLFDVWP